MFKHVAIPCIRYGSMALFITATMVPCAMAQTAQNMGYPADPLLEEPADVTTDAEIGSIGCLVASTVVSGSMLYLMGGIGNAFASMTPPLHPTLVLEGSAAVAFVLSSACYIGVAMAPLAVSTYNKFSERLTQTQSRPLYNPGELWAIGAAGTLPQQQPYAVMPQQPYVVVPQQQPTVGTSQQQPASSAAPATPVAPTVMQ